MPRSIAASIIFRTGKAIAGIGKFKRELQFAAKDAAGLGSQAKKAGLTTGQMLRVMENRRAPTQFQRNVKLTNETIRTFTGLLKEGRIILGKTQSKAKKGIRLRGAGKLKRDLRGIKSAAKQTQNQFGALFGALAIGLGGLGAGAIFDDIRGFFSGAISLASKDEANLVTFNTMLGSAKKSAALMDAITKFSSTTPFQRSDIIEGSRTLLRVTRDNVVENEKLFKLSANIAALKPGTKVAQVGLGIAQATVGEFEILKSFGLVLRAEQFKTAGVKGGAAYTQAVTKEIERQFTSLTGGRDLVSALSQTLTGKASTLKDNAELAGLTLGKAFIEGFGLKGLLDTGITVFSQFNQALSFFTGQTKTLGADIDPTIKTFALFVSEMIDRGKNVITFAKDFFRPLIEGFRSLGSDAQMNILKFVASFGTIGTVLGILTPIIIGIVTIGSLVVTALTPLVGFFLPITAGLLSMTFALASWAAVGGLAFGIFRNDGETVMQTLSRLKDILVDLAVGGFLRLKAFVMPIVMTVLPMLRDSLAVLASNFHNIKTPIRDFFSFFSGDSTLTIEKFAMLGQRIADILIKGIAFGTNLAVEGIILLGKVFRAISPILRPIVSDILNIGRAIFNLVAGADSAQGNLKTIFLGLFDIMTTPLREALRFILLQVEDTVRGLTQAVLPFNESLARKLNASAESLFQTRQKLREGLLDTTSLIRNTELKVKMDADLVAEATIAQPICIDGDVVAESMTKVEMRARNSGRGGDPVSPEELGFVLEGGTRIRPVSLTEVARDI